MRDHRPQEAMEGNERSAPREDVGDTVVVTTRLPCSSLLLPPASRQPDGFCPLSHSCRIKATKLIEERTFDQKGFTPGGNSKNYIIVAVRRSPITFQSLFTSLSPSLSLSSFPLPPSPAHS